MTIVKVEKNTYTVEPLYQWDLNQVLEIRGLSMPATPEVHFTNDAMVRAVRRTATMDAAGVIRAEVPNALLQTAAKVKALICIREGEVFKTYHELHIPVKARQKPADYTITDDQDIYSFLELENLVYSSVASMEAAAADAASAKATAEAAAETANGIAATAAGARATAEAAVATANGIAADARSAESIAINAMNTAADAKTAAEEAKQTADNAVPLNGSAPMTGILAVPAFEMRTQSGVSRGIRFYTADGKQDGSVTYDETGRLRVRQYNLETGKNEYYRLPAVTEGLSANAAYDILTNRNPVTVAQGGTGAKTADEARANLGMGVTLWNGSWKSGSITVPDTAKYRMFMITMDGQGTVIPAFRMESHVRGLGGYSSSTPTVTTFQFAATIDGDKWTFVACNSSADGGTPSNKTVTKVWGLF